MKRRLSILLLCAILPLAISAQLTITGTVTGAQDGATLPGVSILEKGTTNGTVSDLEGKYSIRVSDGAILDFSFVGMFSKEISVEGRTIIDIAMDPDVVGLDEVMVVGYGTMKRSNVTGAISSVNSDDVITMAVSNVEQALQGRASGINVITADGNPGSSMHVSIRGLSTTGRNEPLYIIDGVEAHSYKTVLAENEMASPGVDGWPIGTKRVNGLDNLNPNDIESIEILKDASAAAIYGSRAANGVVLITTKRGKKGKPRLDFDAYWGLKTMPDFPEVMSGADYIDYVLEAYATNPVFSNNPPGLYSDYLADPGSFPEVDWLDEAYTNGTIQNYNLRLSGGNDYANYMISSSYLDDQGVIPGTMYDRITVRSAVDMDFGRLKVGQNLAISTSNNVLEIYARSRPTLYNMAMSLPMMPIRADGMDENGRWITSPDATEYTNISTYYTTMVQPTNSIMMQDIIDDESTNGNLTGNLFAELSIIDNLKYKIDVKAVINRFTRKQFLPTWSAGIWNNTSARLNEFRINEDSYALDQLLTYNKTLGDHHLDATVGFVMQVWHHTSLDGHKENMLSNDIHYFDGDALQPPYPRVWGGRSENAIHSWIGRIAYAYKDRYYLTGSFRRDGSSKFQDDYRWGNFPGVSAKWRVSNENFWENVPVVNELGIRASWGILGRENSIGPYATVGNMGSGAYSFGLSGALTPGFALGEIRNPGLIWEEVEMLDFGLDLGLLENRIWISASYYDSNTHGMLLGRPIPASVGVGGDITSNAGEISNKGFEMEMTYKQVSGEFSFSTTLTLTHNKNKIIDIGGENVILDSGAPVWDVPTTIWSRAGGSFGDFYVIKTDGIFQNEQEILDHVSSDGTVIQPRAMPGDIRFIDANDDGRITAFDDRQYCGNTFPKLEGGLNLNGSYRGFDMTVYFYGNYGNKVYNATNYILEGMWGMYNQSITVLDRWTEDNPSTTMPRANWADNNQNKNGRSESDRFIEDASFLKLRQLQLGYNLPSSVINRVKISSLRIYLSGQNLFTLTKYSGIDPEVGRDGYLNRGVDRGITPQLRTFMVGVQLGI
jgi:TonB-linked SusC/RagA family outer membrane protein